MRSIQEIQQDIISDFSEIGDSFDQYAYLIELSCAHVPMPEKDKTPDRVVEGCQSQVWLRTFHTDNMFSFSSDSNTLIIKGVLFLLEKILNGQTCADVANAEITFLQETEIMATFESDRQKGIGYVIKSLKKAAEDYLAGEE